MIYVYSYVRVKSKGKDKKMCRISTEDLLLMCNSPVQWSAGSSHFLFFKEAQETRCVYKVIGKDKIELFAGNAINRGLAFDWGKREYLRKFLLEISCGKRKIVKNADFLVKQKSIKRLQNDSVLLEEIKKELAFDNEQSYWKKGFSSLLAFVCFRAVINTEYKYHEVFQKGIGVAIDMVYYPFCNCIGWTKNPIQYYDLDDKVRKFADCVRNETVSKIYHWMYEFYELRFVEECFDRMLSVGWRNRFKI